MLRESKPITNGVQNIGRREYRLVVNGVTVVEIFHGSQWDAWKERAKYVEAIAADAAIAEAIETPIDEIEDDFWLNGHIPPMSAKEEFERYCEQFAAKVKAAVEPIKAAK